MMIMQATGHPTGRYSRSRRMTSRHLSISGHFHVGREPEPLPFFVTPFNNREQGVVTGRALACLRLDRETGCEEVYVQPFRGPGGKYQISTEGGYEARWAPDGKEIYYLSRGRVMAVSVASDPGFTLGQRRGLFEGPHFAGRHSYDVSPDSRRFIMIQLGEEEAFPTQLNAVLNSFAELERLVPTN
jgi:hypothetical protein